MTGRGIHGFLAIVALALAGCGQQGESGKQAGAASPQAAIGGPVSGGRNAPAETPARANTMAIDFGDDTSKFARDGECDDKRFAGAGMTATPLLESDVGHDATDCRTAFQQGRLALARAAPAPQPAYAASGIDHIQWGDDASQFAKDGECDDKRFTGAGMTSTPLLDSDIKHDATDCRAAFAQGRLSLRE